MPAARLRSFVIVVFLVVVGAGVDAGAQPLGTFRWQQQPFCNVVTLSVVRNGDVFELQGYDDQCGASTRAAAGGVAFVNPDGTIGMGLTIVTTPGGAPVHVDARISLATLAGPWRDSSGNGGTFAFTPGSGTGGTVRPVTPHALPPGSVDSSHIVPGAIRSTHLAPGSVGASQIDPNQVQARITGTCPVGQYLRGVQPTGAVVCEPLAPSPVAYYAAHHGQLALTAGLTATTILVLQNLPAGTYLFNAHASAADFTTDLSFVRCAIRAAGQDSSGVYGSTLTVGKGATANLVSQLRVSLPVTSASPFNAELYCLPGNSLPGAYIEEPRLYGVRLAAIDVR